MSAYVDRVRSRARDNPNVWLVPAVIAARPAVSGPRGPAEHPAADRRLHADDGDGRRDDRVHDDGRRPEHRRRLLRPARPRLRGLLRRRRVHGRLVRVPALRAGHVPLRLVGEQRPGGHPPDDVARADHRRPADDVRRHRDRAPDAPSPGRLPRDRHPRLRGDHPAGRPERRQLRRLQPHRTAPSGSLRSTRSASPC